MQKMFKWLFASVRSSVRSRLGPPKTGLFAQACLFLCRDIYQRLLTCSLILALCCHCAELLKGDIKFNFQCVISIDINRFDELGNNHLLCSKVAVIIEVSPGLYLLIFFPLYICIDKMNVQFFFRCVYRSLKLC